VLRVGALEHAYVQVDPGALRRLAQEAGRDIGGEPPDALAAELDVGDEPRLVIALERRRGERFRRRDDGAAVTASSGLPGATSSPSLKRPVRASSPIR
jgi:hypothetical protein